MDLKKELGKEAHIVVNEYNGIRVECGSTSCIFEFVTYKYKGKVKKTQKHEVAHNSYTHEHTQPLRTVQYVRSNMTSGPFSEYYPGSILLSPPIFPNNDTQFTEGQDLPQKQLSFPDERQGQHRSTSHELQAQESSMGKELSETS